jgi:hypothetical protein
MSYIFVLLGDKFDWEDMIIFTDDDEAKTESIKHPDCRVEIFSKTKTGYKPTYCHYKNGKLIET